MQTTKKVSRDGKWYIKRPKNLKDGDTFFNVRIDDDGKFGSSHEYLYKNGEFYGQWDAAGPGVKLILSHVKDSGYTLHEVVPTCSREHSAVKEVQIYTK